MNSAKYWVWLSMVFGTGSHRIWDVMHFFEFAGHAYEEIVSGYLSSRLDENEMRNANHIKLDDAQKHIDYCKQRGIGIVTYGESEYPSQLRNIYNPPTVLYYKGNLSCLKNKASVVSVGTRRASAYGIRAAKEICHELAEKGALIISGFAVGIDIASSLAASDINRPSVCVMGCGLDIDYPKENFRFRSQIINSGGVFISEYPPGTSPYPYNFPKRNRILAGLGRTAIVFEASIKSGSLITAGMAMDQGKEVFCLPPADIFSRSLSGNVSLLRDGAVPLYSADDIIDHFSKINELNVFSDSDTYTVLNNIRRSVKNMGVFREISASGTKRKPKPKSDEIAEAEKENAFENKVEDLSPIQQKIIGILSDGAMHADVIAQKLEIDQSELNYQLTELELFGILKSLPGKMFEIN